MDITSISMSLSLCLYLYVFISVLCTFTALTLHQLLHSQSLQHTHLLLLFLFVSYPCRRSRTQVPSRTTTSFASRTSFDSVESSENESTLIWMWKVIFFLIFCFLNFSELEIYADFYPNHFPPFTSNSSFEVSSSKSFTSLRSRFSICFLWFLSLSLPPLQDHRL